MVPFALQLLFEAASTPAHPTSGSPVLGGVGTLFSAPSSSPGADNVSGAQGTLQQPILGFLAQQTAEGVGGGSNVQRLMRKLAQVRACMVCM